MKKSIFGILSASLIIASCGDSNQSVTNLCNGEILIPFQEKINKDWGFLDVNGNLVVDPEFDGKPSFGFNKISVSEDNNGENFFIKMEDGKIIENKTKYTEALDFTEGYSITRKGDNKIEVINDNFEKAFVAEDAKAMRSFSNGYAGFKDKNDKWGFYNTSGKVVIKPQYRAILNSFNSGGYAIVVREKGSDFEVCIIDETGTVKLNLKDKYDEKVSFISSDLLVYYDDGYGIMNLNGEKILKANSGITKILPFVNEYASFQKDNEWGLLNKAGEVIIRSKYDNPLFVFGDLISFKEDGKYGFMNVEEETIIDNDFEEIAYPFVCEYAIVRDNKYFILIDKSGNEIEKEVEFQNIIGYGRLPRLYNVNEENTINSSFDFEAIIEEAMEELNTDNEIISTPEYHNNTSENEIDPKKILEGVWEGRLLGKKLEVVIESVNGNKITGYNVCGSNKRPINGTFSYEAADLSCTYRFDSELSEPGDKKGDGVFSITFLAYGDEVDDDGGPECLGNYKGAESLSSSWSSNTSSKVHEFNLVKR